MRRTSESKVKRLLRAVMVGRSNLNRVGVICHRPHVQHVESIGEPFQARIVKTSYFGSGEDRASNAWFEHCDLIIVAGTPRLPPQKIKSYLFQLGEIEAACRNPKWGEFRWRGQTEAGNQVVISSRGYPHDSDWQAALRDLVRSGIIQAVGRGRGILENGIEVVVLSTDECGILLASDQELIPMSASECTALRKLAELTAEFPNKSIIGNPSYSSAENASPKKCKFPSATTAQLAEALGFSDRRLRKKLVLLEKRRLIKRLGIRSGWTLAEAGREFFSSVDLGEDIAS